MNSLSNEKKDLRKQLKKIRKEIDCKKEKSQIIVNKIINLDVYKKAKVIALYKAMEDEVNIDDLINKSLNDRKIVLLPKIYNKEMFFLQSNQKTKFEKSSYNILEPEWDNEKEYYTGNISLIIVPGLGFDLNKNRIGYGKGYYDKYLKRNDGYKIGICFDEQIVKTIPIDFNDVKMDLIITEKKVA